VFSEARIAVALAVRGGEWSRRRLRRCVRAYAALSTNRLPGQAGRRGRGRTQKDSLPDATRTRRGSSDTKALQLTRSPDFLNRVHKFDLPSALRPSRAGDAGAPRAAASARISSKVDEIGSGR
jgi:hypothetical protein